MTTNIGMSPKETLDYSISRAIYALYTNDWSEAGLERLASEAVAERLNKSSEGFFIPGEVWGRDLVVGTPASGGALVEQQQGNFIDALRRRQTVHKLGATILDDLVGDVPIPKQATASATGWIGEDIDSLKANPKFDNITLTPKTVSSYVEASRRLMLQSTPSIDSLIFSDIAKSVAASVDRAAFAGAGGDEPTGVANTAGVNLVEMGANGGPLTWDKVVELESKAASDNDIIAKPAYLTNYAVSTGMKTTEKVTGNAGFMWDGDHNNLSGYPISVTNTVPKSGTKGTGTDLSTMIFGDWENLVIGEWGVLELLVDRKRYSLSGKIRLIAFYDCDIGVRHPETFSIATDISS